MKAEISVTLWRTYTARDGQDLPETAEFPLGNQMRKKGLKIKLERSFIFLKLR